MKITLEWLRAHDACAEGAQWFRAQEETVIDAGVLTARLIAEARYDWANWLIVRALNRKNRIRYAVFAAESVLPIFEREYPTDKRPHGAIESAKAVIRKGSQKNLDAAAYSARAAARAAYAAARAAADAAYAAARAAADAADAAARAAADAADAAARAAADAAARAAADAAYAADAAELKKIISYGLKLLKGEK